MSSNPTKNLKNTNHAYQRKMFNDIFGMSSLAEWNRYLKQYEIKTEEEIKNNKIPWLNITVFTDKERIRLDNLLFEVEEFRKKWSENDDHNLNPGYYLIQFMEEGIEDLERVLKYCAPEYRKFVRQQVKEFDIEKMKELMTTNSEDPDFNNFF